MLLRRIVIWSAFVFVYHSGERTHTPQAVVSPKCVIFVEPHTGTQIQRVHPGSGPKFFMSESWFSTVSPLAKTDGSWPLLTGNKIFRWYIGSRGLSAAVKSGCSSAIKYNTIADSCCCFWVSQLWIETHRTHQPATSSQRGLTDCWFTANSNLSDPAS